MRLLYFSSFHSTLERDDLNLFNDMGIKWFSTGFYIQPRLPWIGHNFVPSMNIEADAGLIKEFLEINQSGTLLPGNRVHPGYGYLKPVLLNKNIVDQFDAIYISHCCPYPYFIKDNWELLKTIIPNKPVFYRTYAQQTASHELELQEYRKAGLLILRNAPTERNIPNYAGDDAIIRGYVDDKEYHSWNGNDKMVLTFNNNYGGRTYYSNTPAYERIRAHLRGNRFELYGGDNENVPLSLGCLSWEAQKQKYRDARIYFGLGSKPASSTYNNFEAMITGCPIVTWGPKMGNFIGHRAYGPTYEMHQIIENGKDGLCSDSELTIIEFIKKCLNDHDYARALGQAGREKMISLVGKKAVRKAWSDFFKKIGFDVE